MGDYLYYVTAAGRVAKRESKTVADLEREIAALADDESDDALQAQLTAAANRASKGNRVAFQGMRAAKAFLGKFIGAGSIARDIALNLPDGTSQKRYARLDKERELKQLWVAEQEDLAQRYKAQEAGDKAEVKEESKIRKALEDAAIKAARNAAAAGLRSVRKRRSKKADA